MEVEHGPFTALIPDGVRSDAPLVVILGWAGAQDRSLRKYAELIASYGLPSVRSVQPTGHIFSPVAWPRRRWAEALLSFITSRHLSAPRPLVLYAFSNGGGFVIEQIHNLISSTQSPYHYLHKMVLGIIFDSAPGYMHPGAGKRVLEAEMEPGLSRTIKMLTWETATALTPWLYGDRPNIYWDFMRELNLGPELYLYSVDDPLCDAVKLTQLIGEKRAAGKDISSLCWEESAHCGHLKLHKQEYEAALRGFLTEKLGIIINVPLPRARL